MAPYTRITRYGIREANKGLKALNSAESGETQTLSVGDAYPYGDQRYVSSSNDAEHVYIVTSLLRAMEAADGRRIADKKFGWIHPCCTYPLSDIEIEVFPLA